MSNKRKKHPGRKGDPTSLHPLSFDVAIVGMQRRHHLESNVQLVNSRLPIAAETVTALHERYDRLADNWEQRG
ncbi:MAG: hypothetical protein O3B04_04575 [Chloroflexi bacterium]|nr:hypothetical protein [Chloroflexota bacterium]MDA1297264.1 hypothetical protein [Chloroflexota bacterium]